MFASQILPDLQAQLTNIEFGTHLEIHVDAPADVTTPPTISIAVDGTELTPVAGEMSLPTE